MSELLKSWRPELLEGLSPSVSGLNAPFWKDGRNVVFTEGSVQPASGFLLLVPRFQGNPIAGLKATMISDKPTLFFGAGTKLYKWTEDIDTPAEVGTGFTDGKFWVFSRWGNWMLATNNTEAPQIYKGTSFAQLGGIDFNTCLGIFNHKTFAIAYNTDADDGEIAWSDSDDPETWVGTASNMAGDAFTRDLNGPLLCGLSHRNNAFILSNDRMFIMRYVGPPFIFQVEKALDGIGAVGPYSVVSAGDIMYGFSQDGIWRSDGFSKEFLDSPMVHDFVYDQVNKEALRTVVAWHDVAQETITFYFPTGTQKLPSASVMYHYRNGAWSIGNTPWTAAQGRTSFDFPILGNALGDIFFQDPKLQPAGTSAKHGKLPFTEDHFGLLGCGAGGVGHHGFGGEVDTYG